MPSCTISQFSPTPSEVLRLGFGPDWPQSAFLEIKFCVLYQHRGPERKNTPGRNSALATQHPILVYQELSIPRDYPRHVKPH
ncbi:hypothetical protein OUZ56_021924 [Daphnia magna]|uniref:Uncharacterized protein n=1 Tax=Daphnia magna TaxID=35525 RepID=A0ABR0AUZ1_9CRUS|nr:hypothetical protein OUZ56_021924 [Daphnia magna]